MPVNPIPNPLPIDANTSQPTEISSSAGKVEVEQTQLKIATFNLFNYLAPGEGAFIDSLQGWIVTFQKPVKMLSHCNVKLSWKT